MSTVFCDNCGTSLLGETAKFCRACGKPTPLSEAATKRFDEQPGYQTPTNPVGNSFTTPAYIAPFEMPASVQTNDLRQKSQKRNLILLISMLAVMIVALGGLLVFLNVRVGSTEDIPVTKIPKVPSPPGVPGGVPTPSGIDTSSSIDSSLIYPGSTQTMSIAAEGGKRVVTLTTDASSRDVADWYISRLGITKKVAIAGQTILKAGDIGVVITGGEEGTTILITRGGSEE